MSEDICRRFAKSVRAVIPDFPMSDDEIQFVLEDQGLAGFADSDVSVAELIELSELLDLMERRNSRNGA
jgi:hypothetical protein